ncbi:MAG: hypothetical protein CVV47_15825 [Spirochaetae bacterium HGW-Spirochaetae-3]|jgi:hypothetical protein|nr:MAG: hypothetical protein CVV47_15825 [Spirochaetae bacterium HGW-Spirochaetae-3]
MNIVRKRLLGPIAIAALAVTLSVSCGSVPRDERDADDDRLGRAVPDERSSRDEVRAKIAEAMALSLSGETDKALKSVSEAIQSARNAAGRTGALEAKAWALLLAGSRQAAMEALQESVTAGGPSGPGRAVLEFRLAAAEGIAAARRKASESGAPGDIGGRAAFAIAVMLGEKDLRDVEIETPEEASEYATYLAGYSLAPDAASRGRYGPGADYPVIVVAEPESVGADDATMAVARLACRDAIARRGLFRVVDVDSRKAAIEELELELSGATAGDRDKAIGNLYAADYVASGSVVKADSGWLVAYSLSSADDGRIVASDFSMAGDHAAIMSAAARFASALDGLAADDR